MRTLLSYGRFRPDGPERLVVLQAAQHDAARADARSAGSPGRRARARAPGRRCRSTSPRCAAPAAAVRRRPSRPRPARPRSRRPSRRRCRSARPSRRGSSAVWPPPSSARCHGRRRCRRRHRRRRCSAGAAASSLCVRSRLGGLLLLLRGGGLHRLRPLAPHRGGDVGLRVGVLAQVVVEPAERVAEARLAVRAVDGAVVQVVVDDRRRHTPRRPQRARSGAAR